MKTKLRTALGLAIIGTATAIIWAITEIVRHLNN